MTTKIRKQIYVDPLQNDLLKQSSQRLGVSEAEVIRQAIVAQTQRLSSLPRDLKAWEAEYRFIQRLIEQGSTSGQRAWKREELYERGSSG
jgi:hypothetical protein